jgi:hypothetical protein
VDVSESFGVEAAEVVAETNFVIINSYGVRDKIKELHLSFFHGSRKG